MTISELIVELTKHLEEYGDLPVAISDWQEQWRNPSLEAANTIGVNFAYKHWEDGTDKVESVLVIGWD